MYSDRRNSRSPEAQVYRAWYKTTRWQRKAKEQIAAHPLCARCETQGRVTPARVANHRRPHRGDPHLFWYGELESLCFACHDGPVQAEERRGYAIGCDVSGRPLDPNHPWNAKR